MPSSLSWIDYDSEAQQRAQRILTLFKERNTRDELGFGSIRDAISETLFPGTSTIQTRLRYMLFVPWMYQMLEDRHVSPSRIRDYSRWDQLKLSATLKKNTRGEVGIIGASAGDSLTRLPSEIYWLGLERWGIRVFPGTEGQYQRSLDDIYRRRKRARASLSAAAEDGDDIGGLWELGAYTFHPGLPRVPDDFPDQATFRLTPEEARYLQERVRQTCSGSLLADLLAEPVPVSIEFPWQHPDIAAFRAEHQELLRHGRVFSMLAHGASILYCLMLAEKVENETLVQTHRQFADTWLEQHAQYAGDLAHWYTDIAAFWGTVRDRGHDINGRTELFVEEWAAMVIEYGDRVFDAPESRSLVKKREIEKKKGNSRFTNARVRDQWGGYSGTRPNDFRWPLVQTYVSDMAGAFRR